MSNPFLKKPLIPEIEQLKKWDALYYEEGSPVVSDAEYDAFKEKTRTKFPAHPYFSTIGADIKGKKVKLPYTLGSLNKTKPDGSYEKWDKTYEGSKIISPKLDGVSILVQYIDGKVNKAFTRGNGEYGKDITDKAKIFCPVSTEKGTFDIRGECLLADKDHIDLDFKTRRNGVAGLLNNDDIKNCDKIKVLFYELINTELEKEEERIAKLKKHFPDNTIDFLLLETITEEVLIDVLKKFKKAYSTIDIDGLVITLNESEREDTKYPDTKVAFKVSEPAVKTTVESIKWCTGRTGRVVPLVNIIPVNIQGVTISKATGHNWKYILDNKIGKNAEILIQRSGDVIPYIVGVVKETSEEIVFPKCPSCKYNLVLSKTGVDACCINPSCPAQTLSRTEYFFSTLGAENISETTFKNIRINSIKEAYETSEDDIIKLPGFGEKSAKIIVDEIQKTLKTRPDKLLAAFGLPGIGIEVSRSILKQFDFDEIWTLEQKDFERVSGIGSILSENLVKGLKECKLLYEYLIEKGLEFEIQDNILRGKNYCLTGNGPMPRDQIKKLIESKGGHVKGMSKKIDVLVAGDIETKSGKAKKAKDYGIPIITYNKLMEEII